MKNVAPAQERGMSIWRSVVVCILVTAVGFQLRSVILAVPPLLPLIQRDLRLSYATTGLLTSLPVLMLACAAWPAGLLAERIGPRACVSIGLVLLGVGSLLRALWTTTLALFLFTLLLSLGITIAQTAVPVLIRRWFPAHIGLVAALFSDGLIIGEAVAAGVTVPIMKGFLGNDAWPATFVFWSLPVILLVILWLWLAPPASVNTSAASFASSTPSATKVALPAMMTARKKDAPTRQRTRVGALHLGILVGGGSLVYFGMNAWIASYNLALHHAELTPLALALLNAAQFPVSLMVTLFARRFTGQRLLFVIAGIICVLSIMGWIFTPITLEPLWATLLGGSSALVFTLGVALPPLLAEPHEVGSLTGMTIALTYAVAFFGPLLGGALWDIFHLPAVAFTPVIIASLMLIVLGMLLPPRSAFGL